MSQCGILTDCRKIPLFHYLLELRGTPGIPKLYVECGRETYKFTKLYQQNLAIFMFLRWPLYFKFFLKHFLFYLYKLDSFFFCL